jgi:gamma-glutamyltranspeptidase
VSVLPLTSGAGAILRERGTWAGGADPRREGTARGERP